MNAVRVGFEPTKLSLASFQDWCDRPLHHLTFNLSSLFVVEIKQVCTEVRAGIVRRIGGLHAPHASHRLIISCFTLEVRAGIEPAHRSFADSRVSTSPTDHIPLTFYQKITK